LGDRKEICPIKNLYQLPPKVLIRNKWRNGTEGNQLTQVYLENGKYERGMYYLWPPYVIGQAVYIFILWFLLLLLFFPRLISAVGDWMSTILPHMVWP